MFCADGVIRKLKGSSEGKPFSQKKSLYASKIDLQFLSSEELCSERRKYFSFIFPSTCRFFVFALCFNRYKSIR